MAKSPYADLIARLADSAASQGFVVLDDDFETDIDVAELQTTPAQRKAAQQQISFSLRQRAVERAYDDVGR